MRDLWLDAVIASQNKLVKMREEWMDERGADNMVGTIIMIVVIIGLAITFRDRIAAVAGTVFDKLDLFVGE